MCRHTGAGSVGVPHHESSLHATNMTTATAHMTAHGGQAFLR